MKNPDYTKWHSNEYCFNSLWTQFNSCSSINILLKWNPDAIVYLLSGSIPKRLSGEI